MTEWTAKPKEEQTSQVVSRLEDMNQEKKNVDRDSNALI